MSSAFKMYWITLVTNLCLFSIFYLYLPIGLFTARCLIYLISFFTAHIWLIRSLSYREAGFSEALTYAAVQKLILLGVSISLLIHLKTVCEVVS